MLHLPQNSGVLDLRMGPNVKCALSEILNNLWGPMNNVLPDSWHEEILAFLWEAFFMMDVKIERPTSDHCTAADAVCKVLR